MEGGDEVLGVVDLSVAFPGHKVLDRIGFSLRAGSVMVAGAAMPGQCITSMTI